MTEAIPPAKAPSLLSRVIGIIVSPKATFQKIVPAPTVLGVILLVGVAVGLSQGLPRLSETGRQAALDAQVKQTEKFTGQPVSEEQYARMQKFAPVTAYATIAVTPIIMAIAVLLFGGIYFVIFNVILGGTASFKQVASIVAHASIITALGAVLAAPVQYFQGTANPMGPFTLGALLPALDENSFLARFLGFVGVFSIWGTIVTAIGFGVLYRRKTSNIAIGLFALTALFAAVGATVTGFFSGR